MESATEVVSTVAPATPGGDMWGMIVYCLIVLGVLYVFMVRPNKRRMAEYQKMIDSLAVGNRVMAAGIYGTIKKIGEKTIELEIAKGVVIEVSKNAIASVE